MTANLDGYLGPHLQNDGDVAEEAASSKNPYVAVTNWHRAAHQPVSWEPVFEPKEPYRSDVSVDRILEKVLREWRLLNVSQAEVVALEPLERTIDDSAWILELKLGWDDKDALPISRDTWDRAMHITRSLAQDIFEHFHASPPLPRIGPVADGSIDLVWDDTGRSLLINVPPSEKQTATYGGHRDDGNSIGGELTMTSFGHVSAWLMNR